MQNPRLHPVLFTISVLATLLLVWIIQVTMSFLIPVWDPTQLGLRPREWNALIPGMLLMPVLHGGWGHLISNGVALAFLLPLFLLSHRSDQRALGRLLILWLGTGLLLWLIGPSRSLHIGASGLVYALSGYLVVYGLRGGHWIALIAALLIVFFQTASLIAGLIPTAPEISYSGHWCGLLVGAITGFKSPAEQKPDEK